ncbi:hypothetical protein [Pseudacidovorax intermedius]|nr:hypothetical protein [Pseudacidovorax intermedius]
MDSAAGTEEKTEGNKPGPAWNFHHQYQWCCCQNSRAFFAL